MREEQRSILLRCAAVALISLGCVTAANAFVRGSISPEFTIGSTDYGFGWKADLLVNTSTGTCAPTSSYVGVTSYCTGATLVSATGELDDPYPTTQIPVGGSFSFTGSPGTYNTISVYFDGSTVVGLNTPDPIGYYTLAANLSNPVTTSPVNLRDGQYFWVQMLYTPTPVPPPESLLLDAPSLTGTETANLITQPLCPPGDGDSDRDDSCKADPSLTSNLSGPASGRDITLSVVPEPGSIALIFGALAAVGFVRRRRQQL